MIKSKVSILKDAWSICKSEKRYIFQMTIVMIITSLMEAVGVFSILPFMALVSDPTIIHKNVYLSYAFQNGGFATERSFLLACGVAVFGLISLSSFLSAFSMWENTRFTNLISHRLALRLLDSYLGQEYLFFVKNNSANLGTNILVEVSAFTGGFLKSIMDFLARGAVVLVICIMLVMVNPTVALQVLLGCICVYGFLAWFTKGSIQRHGAIRRKAKIQMYKVLNELFVAIREVKLYATEVQFKEKVSEHSLEFAVSNSWSMIVSQLPKYLLELLGFGTLILVILLNIAYGKSTVDIVPILSLYALAGYRILPAVQSMFSSLTMIRFNSSSVQGLADHLIKVKTSAGIAETKIEEIEFREILELKVPVFSYSSGGEKILKDIQFRLRKNESVAILGPTGSGKSTMVDILCGLIHVENGGIYIDGKSVDTVEKLNGWQKKLGYVSQQTQMLDSTVEENVAFGVPAETISASRVQSALEKAQLWDFINQLPLGLKTKIGERGVRFSGGQRQRLGIARALYRNPEVLILDEATSALDQKTEKAVLDSVLGMRGNKTLVMITHRVSAVASFDRIILLDKGNIVAEGDYRRIVSTPEFNEILATSKKSIEPQVEE